MKHMNVGSAQHEAAEEPVVLLLVEEEWWKRQNLTWPSRRR